MGKIKHNVSHHETTRSHRRKKEMKKKTKSRERRPCSDIEKEIIEKCGTEQVTENKSSNRTQISRSRYD
jgi:hypothetical protein